MSEIKESAFSNSRLWELGKSFNSKYKDKYMLVQGVVKGKHYKGVDEVIDPESTEDYFLGYILDKNERGERPFKEYVNTKGYLSGLVMKIITPNWTVYQACLDAIDKL